MRGISIKGKSRKIFQRIALFNERDLESVGIFYSGRFKHRNDLSPNGLGLICIEVEPPKAKSVLVLAWYRPPSDTFETFEKMEKIVSYLDKESKEFILLGDTNCDFGNKEKDHLTDNNPKLLSNIYNIYGLKQLIEDPTRATSSSSTIIDHIATSCNSNIIESGVYEVSMSDHYMVYCIRNFNGAIAGITRQ